MISKETKKKKYLNEILNLIWDLIALEAYKISRQILIPKQRVNLADIDLFHKDFKVIYDYFFVIDRFCNIKIIPKKYEIKYSSIFNIDLLTNQELENLNFITSILLNENNERFRELNRFYPKSSEKYINKPYGSIELRFNVDFCGSIWGIKHLHLKEKQRGDNLLYYVVIKNIIYFIGIGSHDEMYKKTMLEVIVNEFQNILHYLGIGYYIDMPFENYENLSIDKIKQKWLNGENIGFFINEKFYISTNLMAGSKIKANLNYQISNISFQIKNQATEFVQSLLSGTKVKDDLEIRLDENIDYMKNELLIKEESQKIAQFFYINYLETLNQTKNLVKIYCN